MADGERPIDAVLARLKGVSRTGDDGKSWKCYCPAHEDGKKSLSVSVTEDGQVLARCFAGCTFKQIAAALSMREDEFFAEMGDGDFQRFMMPGGVCGPEEPSANGQAALSGPITVEALAANKGLPVEYLRGKPIWLRDLSGGVGIPYFAESTSEQLLVRPRTALRAKDGSYWERGKKLTAYGRWKLKYAKELKYLILVEGESDVWTLWYHDFPALGIPGANAGKVLEAKYLTGIERLYIFREPLGPDSKPGTGGDAFVNGLGWQLKKIGFKGAVRVVTIPGVKDPNDLHRRDPARFRVDFQKCLDAAVPMPEPVSPRELHKRQTQPAEQVELAAAAAAQQIPPAKGGFFAATDWGNALRLVHRHGEKILYCHSWKKWLIWDGYRFRIDDTNEIMRLAKETVLSIYAEVKNIEAAQLRDEVARHAMSSEAAKRLFDFLKLAESEEKVSIKPERLDRDGWLLNVENGTVDLRSGELSDHRPIDRITKLAPVRFDKDATCPLWELFLDRIMAGRKDVISFLQRAVGYSMTASVCEKCLFFLYGGGDNGKSVFVETLASLIGDYWMKTPAETILSRPGRISDAIPNDVARLVNVRMVSAAEVDEGRQLNEARIKDLTGGDTISARFMRAEWFDFIPVFKLWMYGNHKPVVTGTDDAIWGRIRLVPFTVTIPKAEQDLNLKEKLKVELPGILNWAIRGCLEWQRDGLGLPVDVAQAVSEYRHDMDIIGAFLEECCTMESWRRVRSSSLFARYQAWCQVNGEHARTQTKLSILLTSKGFMKRKISEDGNCVNWIGFDLGNATENHANGDANSNNDRHNTRRRSGLEQFDT